jgi:hypothetical protein
VVPVKTMILLRAGSNFAGLVVRKNTLDVEFMLRRLLTNRRIHKTDRLGQKYTHRIRLTSIDDVNAQLVGWLREAYEAAARVT